MGRVSPNKGFARGTNDPTWKDRDCAHRVRTLAADRNRRALTFDRKEEQRATLDERGSRSVDLLSARGSAAARARGERDAMGRDFFSHGAKASRWNASRFRWHVLIHRFDAHSPVNSADRRLRLRRLLPPRLDRRRARGLQRHHRRRVPPPAGLRNIFF